MGLGAGSTESQWRQAGCPRKVCINELRGAKIQRKSPGSPPGFFNAPRQKLWME